MKKSLINSHLIFLRKSAEFNSAVDTLSYELKTDEIMQSLKKMDEYYIDVKDVEAEKLLDLYHKIQLDDSYYERLKKEVERIQKESLIDLKKIVAGYI